MVKVSVIVPVYNVEPYLRRCLDSLVNQTLKEIEIIIVNDGATDRSGEIAKEYAEKYGQIKYYEKPNGGLSDARNYGFRYANGEYIGYVDSDDYVDDTMFEVLYAKACKEHSDIVECNLRHTYAASEDIEIGEKIQDKKKMLMFGRSVVWNKIYKREWLVNTKVQFHKGIIYEDVEFYLKLIPHIRVYSYVDEAPIHYVQRESSINNISSAKTLDILKVLTAITKYYKENGYYDEYKDALEFFYTRILLCSSFKRMCKIRNKKERKDALYKNWSLLIETFPNWKENKILRCKTTKNRMFMKSVNPTTYKIYSVLLPVMYQLKATVKHDKVR